MQAFLAFWRQNAQHPYGRVALILAVFLVLFLLGRLGLYTVYHDEFSQLSLADTLFAFLYGVRFDASTIIIFIGFPLLFLLLPFQWAHSRLWQGFWLLFQYAVLVLFILTLVGDGIYFSFVQRHTGPEIHALFGDTDIILDVLATEHALLVGITLMAALYGGKLWMKAFHYPIARPTNRVRRLAMILILLPIMVIVGRGGLQYKPVEVVDAFSYGNAQQGYLTLSGPFAVQHSLMQSAPQRKHFMPAAEAIQTTRKLIIDDGQHFVSEQYPLMRQNNTGKSGNPPNIVVVMMESWDAIHIDSIRQVMGEKPIGVTPNFDALSRQGLLFPNFYASGRRSMDGMAAILAGIPTLPGVPYIGTGLEQSQLSYIGHLAKANNYNTFFLRSANRGSFHLDSVSATAGFDLYKGAEDMPTLHTNVPEENTWGAWDHETFTEAHKHFTASDKPFLAVLFSSTTHNPFRVPGTQWYKFPHDGEKNKFFNTLYYSDWALGELIKNAKAAGYFDNTIFLITADHISRFGNNGRSPKSRFHIPLLITGPGIQAGLNTHTGSQLDIMPTIAELAGWQQPYSSLGRSLLSKTSENAFAVGVDSNIISVFNDDITLSRNLEKRLYLTEKADAGRAAQLEHDMLALYQTTLNLLLSNRVYSDSKSAP